MLAGQQDWLKTLSGMDIPPGARLGMTTDGNLLLLGVSGSLTRLSLNGLKKSLSGPSPESERDKTGSAGTARPSSDIHRHTLGLSAPFEGPFLQAEVNSHDKLLAIRTPSRVLVIVVPLPGLSSTQGSFKTTEVGASVFVGGLQVLQIEWHPRSASGTHLMVLSSDGLLRLFDLSISPEEPEQIFDLTRPGSQFPSSSQHILPSKNRRGIFSAETSEREVVSFAVGAAGDVGWSSLTVYAAMENGDIYSLCPVMPSTCSLSLGQVQSLRSRLGQPKNDEDSTEKKNRYWTLRWIQEVEEQIIRHEDSLPSDLVQVSLPKFHTKLGLFRQGPFLKPASSSDEDDESRSLTDMHIVFDLHAQYLWTAYSNGSVELRVNFRPPTPIWGNLNISGLDEPPEWTRSSLQYLETLELLESPSETLGSALTLVKDPKYSDVVYVAHSEGIHRLSLRPWKLLFDECLCSNPTSSLEALDFEIVFSECDWLVSTENPVTGLVVVTDIYLGYCYMTSTKEGRLYGSPLAIRAPSKPTAAFKIKMKASESVSYPSVLRGTSFTIPEVLKSIPAYIPISSSDSSTYPLFITEHSLPKFSKSVAQLRKRLEAIIGAGGQIQSR